MPDPKMSNQKLKLFSGLGVTGNRYFKLQK